MPEFCRVERDGRILLVTIDRPEVLNALHPPANRELGEAFDAFAADPGLWVAILTGAGERAFSAGNDLKFQASSGGRLEIPPAGFGGSPVRPRLFGCALRVSASGEMDDGWMSSFAWPPAPDACRRLHPRA